MQLTKQLLHTTDAYIKKLADAGILTAQDFLQLYPKSIEDRNAQGSRFSQLDIRSKVAIEVEIISLTTEMTRNKKHLTKAVVADADGLYAHAVWFGQRFVSQKFHTGDRVQLFGKLEYEFGKFQFQSPEIDFPLVQGQTFVPVYSDVHYIPGNWIHEKMQHVRSALVHFDEILPESIKKKHGFLGRRQSLDHLHFPKSRSDFEAAQSELGYTELYQFQWKGIEKKYRLRTQFSGQAAVIPLHAPTISEALEKLPFALTGKQKIVLFQILKDMELPYPMARLLQGDVGTGKTLVVFLAMLHISAQTGMQSAFLVPTEILAQQHVQSFFQLFPDSLMRVELLTGSVSAKEKQRIKEALKHGQVDILIGTHAILQEDVQFHSLAFVVVDEQHRFGVEQRAILEQTLSVGTAIRPHVLNMTATPIPRTLSLVFYGDQDVSILNEYPAGRKPIFTKIIKSAYRNEAYDHIRTILSLHQQIYWISPLVEESEALDVANATNMQELLRAIFPEARVGLIHGKMKSADKEAIMQAFYRREIDILSSTSVIEVGVNNPNATVMCIEGAERFGLSAIHQFRGRVGRGEDQSYCFLFPTNDSSTQRLRALEKSNDGFELSELDLELRGPGEVYGVRQSGIPDLHFASLMDMEQIERVREDIEEYLEVVSKAKGK